MRDLHLPRSQHPLDIGANIVEGQGLREVIARGEIATNLLRRDRRDNGTARDVGLDVRHDTPDVVKGQG